MDKRQESALKIYCIKNPCDLIQEVSIETLRVSDNMAATGFIYQISSVL